MTVRDVIAMHDAYRSRIEDQHALFAWHGSIVYASVGVKVSPMELLGKSEEVREEDLQPVDFIEGEDWFSRQIRLSEEALNKVEPEFGGTYG